MKFSPASSWPPKAPLPFKDSCHSFWTRILDPRIQTYDCTRTASLFFFFFLKQTFPLHPRDGKARCIQLRKGSLFCYRTPHMKSAAERLSPSPQPADLCSKRATAMTVSQALAAACYLFLCVFTHKREQTWEWLKVKMELSITTEEGRSKSQNSRLVLVDNFIYMLQWSLTPNWKLSCCWKIEGLQHFPHKVWFEDEFYFS